MIYVQRAIECQNYAKEEHKWMRQNMIDKDYQWAIMAQEWCAEYSKRARIAMGLQE